MTKNEHWILSEFQVARDRILNHSEKLLFHREQTPFAEVDLLFRGPRELSMLEVKTWSESAFGDLWKANLLRRKQLRRLMNARLHLQERFSSEVELILAVVSHDDEFDPGAVLNPTIEYFELSDLSLGY